jgi:hypothetical protein
VLNKATPVNNRPDITFSVIIKLIAINNNEIIKMYVAEVP